MKANPNCFRHINTFIAMPLLGKSSQWRFRQSIGLAVHVTPRLQYNQPSKHWNGNLACSSTQKRSFAGHSGVSATLTTAGMLYACHTTTSLLADPTIDEIHEVGSVIILPRKGSLRGPPALPNGLCAVHVNLEGIASIELVERE